MLFNCINGGCQCIFKRQPENKMQVLEMVVGKVHLTCRAKYCWHHSLLVMFLINNKLIKQPAKFLPDVKTKELATYNFKCFWGWWDALDPPKLARLFGPRFTQPVICRYVTVLKKQDSQTS